MEKILLSKISMHQPKESRKLTRKTVIGKRVTEVFPGVESFGLFEVFKRVWKDGKTEYYPLSIYKDDKDEGSWRENWIYKLPNANIVAIYNQITDRQKAEEKLTSLKMFNEKVINSVGDAILVIDPNNFQIISANDAAFKQLKISKDDLIGKTCYRGNSS